MRRSFRFAISVILRPATQAPGNLCPRKTFELRTTFLGPAQKFRIAAASGMTRRRSSFRGARSGNPEFGPEHFDRSNYPIFKSSFQRVPFETMRAATGSAKWAASTTVSVSAHRSTISRRCCRLRRVEAIAAVPFGIGHLNRMVHAIPGEDHGRPGCLNARMARRMAGRRLAKRSLPAGGRRRPSPPGPPRRPARRCLRKSSRRVLPEPSGISAVFQWAYSSSWNRHWRW